MYLPPRIYAIRRMPPRIAIAWAARYCEWCKEKPTHTVHYWLHEGKHKTCKLACEGHANEASARTGLAITK